MRATTYSGVVCGVPVTIIPLSSVGSQGLSGVLLIPARLQGRMIAWEGSPPGNAELNPFLNFQTLDSLLSQNASPLQACFVFFFFSGKQVIGMFQPGFPLTQKPHFLNLSSFSACVENLALNLDHMSQKFHRQSQDASTVSEQPGNTHSPSSLLFCNVCPHEQMLLLFCPGSQLFPLLHRQQGQGCSHLH